MGGPGSGKPKTPTAILNKRGSWRGKAAAKTEPRLAPGMPPAPKSLRGYAKKTWTQMCRDLDAIGVLTHVDGKALERYCQGWATWCDMAMDTSPDEGYKRFDKLWALSDKLLKFEMQYGLTPASRPNVHRLKDTPAHGNAKADKTRFFSAS